MCYHLHYFEYTITFFGIVAHFFVPFHFYPPGGGRLLYHFHQTESWETFHSQEKNFFPHLPEAGVERSSFPVSPRRRREVRRD